MPSDSKTISGSSDLTPLDPANLSRWTKIFEAFLGTRNCEKGLLDPPELDEDAYYALLDDEGDDTDESLEFEAKFKKRLKRWKKKNSKVYGYLVKASELNESAMEVVLDENNSELTAADLLRALEGHSIRGRSLEWYKPSWLPSAL